MTLHYRDRFKQVFTENSELTARLLEMAKKIEEAERNLSIVGSTLATISTTFKEIKIIKKIIHFREKQLEIVLWKKQIVLEIDSP